MATIPVSLLCGFLGSGKTTLLSQALAKPELTNTAIIVNEFGDVSIDHLVVAQLSENVIELRNGCLCCTIRGDLALNLRDLYQRRQLEEVPRFDRVVVETSGLADPIPLIHTLMANPPLMKAFHLAAVICVLDSANALQTVNAHDTAANQLAMADIIVVSKQDLVGTADREQVRTLIKQINPHAEVLYTQDKNLDISQAFTQQAFAPGASDAAIQKWLSTTQVHTHAEAYVTHSIVVAGTLSLAGTSVFLNHIVNEQRDQILRIKGLAGFRERNNAPALLHAVQDKFYPIAWLSNWPSEDHRSRLVFIGRELDTDNLEAKFSSLCV